MFEEDIQKLGLNKAALKAEGIGVVEEIAALYAVRLVDSDKEFKNLPPEAKKNIVPVRTQNLITRIITARYAGQIKLTSPEFLSKNKIPVEAKSSVPK